ncbi:MAG: anti-sigma factor family protein [Kiloniellaceae bacterium]
MTKQSTTITADDLHAYADGKLTPMRAAEVEAYLAEHPAAAAEVADYQSINAAMRSVFDGVLDEPIPSAQVAVVLDRRPRFAVPAAAAVAGMMLGAGLTWFAQFGAVSPEGVALAELAEKSTAAYVVYAPEKRHPVEVVASESDHLSAWLSNRMNMSFRIPRLGDLGFELVGGRLMVGDATPAALLMYENAQGRRLVLYVRNDLPEKADTAMRYGRAQDTGVVTWTSGEAGYGLAGAFSQKELLPAAQLVRAQLAL